MSTPLINTVIVSFARAYRWVCAATLLGILSAGMIYAFIFPAFQVADEDMHWFTANAIYEEWASFISRTPHQGCGQSQALSQKFDINALKSNTTEKGKPGELERAMTLGAACPSITLVERSSFLSYPGAMLGRLLVTGERDDPFQAVLSFYIARACQGLVLVGLFLRLLWFLFRSPHMRGFGLFSLLLFCLSPMVLNQSFGVSYDMILIACVVYGVGLLLYHQQVTTLDTLTLLLLSWGACCAKPIFLPWAATSLATLLVLRYLNRSTRPVPTIDYLLIGFGIPALCFVCVAITMGEMSGAEAAMSWRPDIDPRYNLTFLLSDPLRAWSILWGSAWGYLHLGWMATPLGWTNVSISLDNQLYWIKILRIGFWVDGLALTISLLSQLKNEKWGFIMKWAGSIGASLAVTVATVAFMVFSSLAMYLVWTTRDALDVMGLQRRYFLPVYLAGIGAASLFLGGALYRQAPSELQPLPGNTAARISFWITMLVASVFFVVLILPHIVAISIDVLARYY